MRNTAEDMQFKRGCALQVRILSMRGRCIIRMNEDMRYELGNDQVLERGHYAKILLINQYSFKSKTSKTVTGLWQAVKIN